MTNPFNQFMQKHAGQGYSPDELRKMWKDHKRGDGDRTRATTHHDGTRDSYRGRGETLVPADDGGVRSRGSRTLEAHLHWDQVEQFRVRPDELAAVWFGFAGSFRAPASNRPDPVKLFTAAPSVDGGHAPVAPVELRHLAQEREFGRQLGGFLATARVGLAITREEWLAWFDGVDVVSPSPAVSTPGKGDVAWVSPLRIPTRVTSPFGESRGADGPHRGVDLAAPEGSEVQAPAAAVVDDVWEEDRGGKCLRLVMRRPDGQAPRGATPGDDSRLTVTFAHLSEQLVSPGQEVAAGQLVARSGNTGKTTGPHLHVMTVYDLDAPLFSTSLNELYPLDPAGVYGPALTGGPGQGPRPNTAIQALDLDKNGKGKTINVVVNNNGAIMLGNGVLMKDVTPVLHLSAAIKGDVDWQHMSATSRAVAAKAGLPSPSDVVEGVGNLAGQFFRYATSQDGRNAASQGVRAAGGAVGGLLGLGGAVGTAVSPVASSIPYVGWLVPIASTAASIASPIVNTASSMLSSLIGGSPVPALPDLHVEALAGPLADLAKPAIRKLS